MKTKDIILITLVIICAILSKSLYNLDKKFNKISYEHKSEKSACAKEMYNLARISPKKSLVLYQLMKDVDMVLRHHQIVYWAEGGTLLGALRNNGIIPYDDDLDIQISHADNARLKIALEDIKKLGYEVDESNENWLQVKAIDRCSGEENHMDIFLMEVLDTKTKYANPDAEKFWGSGVPPRKSEIYPVVEHKFGEFTIFIPKDPHPYLTRYLGKEYMTKGCIFPQHSNDSVKRRRCFQLDEGMFEPSVPVGPLEDRKILIYK
jgi:lipopolysaccharide cholinephosphotransferase